MIQIVFLPMRNRRMCLRYIPENNQETKQLIHNGMKPHFGDIEVLHYYGTMLIRYKEEPRTPSKHNSTCSLSIQTLGIFAIAKRICGRQDTLRCIWIHLGFCFVVRTVVQITLVLGFICSRFCNNWYSLSYVGISPCRNASESCMLGRKAHETKLFWTAWQAQAIWYANLIW